MGVSGVEEGERWKGDNPGGETGEGRQEAERFIVEEETGRKMEVRQITWWFTQDILGQKISKVTSDNRCLLIGVYAARPTVPAGERREHEVLSDLRSSCLMTERTEAPKKDRFFNVQFLKIKLQLMYIVSGDRWKPAVTKHGEKHNLQ